MPPKLSSAGFEICGARVFEVWELCGADIDFRTPSITISYHQVILIINHSNNDCAGNEVVMENRDERRREELQW